MNVTKSTLPQIFNAYRVLEIPFFQRAYVWEEEQWARLLGDVEDACASGEYYFLGAIILKEKSTSSAANESEVRIVIDGQQRLTALSLLGKAFYIRWKDRMEQQEKEGLVEELDEKEKEERLGEKDNMVQFDRSFRASNNSIALRHNDTDRAIYEQIMKLDHDTGLVNSDSRIAQTYNYFYRNLKLDVLNANSIRKLLMFVNIDLDVKDDEQQIFDAINSLGVRLTAAELLKNYFFHRGSEDRENYEKYWKSVFERDADTQKYWDTEFVTTRKRESMIDPFFFSYLQIRVQGDLYVAPKDKDKFSKAGRLFESYKNYIDVYLKEDRTPILEDIKGYAEVFRNAIDKGMLDSPTPRRGIARINTVIFGLNMSTAIPYILFVEKNVADEEERNKIYDCLEVFIVSRLLTGKETRGYDTLFGTTLIAREISSSEKLRKFLSTEAVGGNAIPTYAEIQQAFHERTNIRNASATVILYLIESKLREADDSTALHPLKVYSLEHMMPKKWKPSWPKTEDPKLREQKLLTLGNLTIVTEGLNRKMSNSPWQKKRVFMKELSIGIRTLFGALEKEEWDEQAIEERAEKLAETLADMYGIDRTPALPFYPKTDGEDVTVPGPLPEPPSPLHCTLGDKEVTLTGRSIVKFKYLDKEQPVSSWADMFEQVVKILHQKNKSVLANLVKQDSGLLGKNVRSNRGELRIAIRIDDHIYVEGNTNTETKISQLRQLFDLYETDKTALTFFYRSKA